MSDRSWNDVMERERRKSEAGGGTPAEDEPALLPTPGDPYRASSRPSNKPLTRIWLVGGREEFKPGGKPYRFFQYVHLDSDGVVSFEERGQKLILRFSGMKPMQVELLGRNLLQIADYLSLHRLAWLRVADRDFQDGGNEPIIKELKISDAN